VSDTSTEPKSALPGEMGTIALATTTRELETDVARLRKQLKRLRVMVILVVVMTVATGAWSFAPQIRGGAGSGGAGFAPPGAAASTAATQTTQP
jgi:hypothetical protein